MWTPEAQKSLEELKDKQICAAVLALVCFKKVFEVECDAFKVGKGAVLIREGRSLAYFSKKLSDARQRYSTYDKKFFAII